MLPPAKTGELCLPRFFFDVHDGKIVIDDVGMELPGFEACREEARRIAFSLASDITLKRDAVQLRVNVRDHLGLRIYTGTLMFLIEAPH